MMLLLAHMHVRASPAVTEALQVNGHFAAKLDPLGLTNPPVPTVMDPKLYGFSDADMERECAPSHCLGYLLFGCCSAARHMLAHGRC